MEEGLVAGGELGKIFSNSDITHTSMTRLLIIALTLLASCVSIYNKKDFTYYKDTNAAKADLLNTNGYFYHLDSLYLPFNYKFRDTSHFFYGKDVTGMYLDSIKAYVISTIVLYKNGRALIYDNERHFDELTLANGKYVGENTFTAAKLAFQTHISNIDNRDYTKDKVYKSGIWCWGAFKFENNTLRIQYFSRNASGSYELIELECPVLNKNTFRIVKRKNISKPKSMQSVDHIYSLENYANKPDSTNNYLDHLIKKISNN